MRIFLFSLLFCLTAHAQCGSPIETIYFPSSYSSIKWQLVKTDDGRLIYIPIVDGYWPTITEQYWNGQIYRNYNYSLPVTPFVAKEKPKKTTEEEFVEAVANLKKEVEDLKKELGKIKEPSKGSQDGPTTPLKDR